MRNKLLIFTFFSLIFLFPLFTMGWESSIGDDTSYKFPSGVDYDVYVDLEWGGEGDLIYWHLEVLGEVRFYFINSSKIWTEPIFSTVIEAGNIHEYNITLPYEDTFWFLIVNQAASYTDMDGWYAKDETVPIGEMWGIHTNFADEVLIGSTADLNCIFTDFFGLSEIILYENEVMVQSINISSLAEYHWAKNDYKFTTLGDIEITFEATDLGGNVGRVSKMIKVVNKLSRRTTTPITVSFDWVGIFENYWFIIIPIGAVLGIAAMFGLEKAGILH